MQFAGNQAKFSFDGMEFDQTGRGADTTASSTITLARALAAQPAAHRDPDQRKIKGV
jgi:hypothetical protein